MKKIIAIDPGMHNSGLAVYEGKFTRLEYPNLWQLMEYIHKVGKADYKDDVLFLVENSNLNKNNWHGHSARGGVGKNKAISQEIVNHCKRCGVKLIELPPTGYSKVYAGVRRQFFETDTKWYGKSNEHNRAACAMIMRYINQKLK